MRVKFTCASVGETAQTITTGQFEDLNFSDGQLYKITFENGSKSVARVTRNGRTLYIASNEFPSGLKKAKVGSPVVRSIKGIKKVK